MLRTPAILVALLLATPGCVLPGDAAGTSGIHGQALIGPTCPVEREPPDPDCADRPYKGKLAVVDADDPSDVVKEFESEANGTFRVPVPPGEYRIQHAGQGTPPSCSTNETITVAPGGYTWVFVHCDSGIR